MALQDTMPSHIFKHILKSILLCSCYRSSSCLLLWHHHSSTKIVVVGVVAVGIAMVVRERSHIAGTSHAAVVGGEIELLLLLRLVIQTHLLLLERWIRSIIHLLGERWLTRIRKVVRRSRVHDIIYGRQVMMLNRRVIVSLHEKHRGRSWLAQRSCHWNATKTLIGRH